MNHDCLGIPSVRIKDMKDFSISSGLSSGFSLDFMKDNIQYFSFKSALYFYIFVVLKKKFFSKPPFFRIFWFLVAVPVGLLNFAYIRYFLNFWSKRDCSS